MDVPEPLVDAGLLEDPVVGLGSGPDPGLGKQSREKSDLAQFLVRARRLFVA